MYYRVYTPSMSHLQSSAMFSKLLAGSVGAMSIGQAYAAGYAWSGVNMAGFDFGCDTTVSALFDPVLITEA